MKRHQLIELQFWIRGNGSRVRSGDRCAGAAKVEHQYFVADPIHLEDRPIVQRIRHEFNRMRRRVILIRPVYRRINGPTPLSRSTYCGGTAPSMTESCAMIVWF